MSRTAFAKCQEVERESRRRMLPYIRHVYRCEPILLPSDFDSQRKGDFTIRRPDGFVFEVEAKAERETTGNLFLETVSNWHTSRIGWFQTSAAWDLWYHFLDTDYLYRWRLGLLREWFWGDAEDIDSGVCNKYRIVSQKQHEQHNLTQGYVVPCKDLLAAGMQLVKLRDPSTWD